MRLYSTRESTNAGEPTVLAVCLLVVLAAIKLLECRSMGS